MRVLSAKNWPYFVLYLLPSSIHLKKLISSDDLINQFMHLSDSRLVSDAAFPILNLLKDLRRIYLRKCPAVHGTTLFVCNQLEVLSVNLCNKVDDASIIKVLQHCNTLEELILFNTGITTSTIYTADIIVQAMNGRRPLTIHTNVPQHVPYEVTPPLRIQKHFLSNCDTY